MNVSVFKGTVFTEPKEHDLEVKNADGANFRHLAIQLLQLQLIQDVAMDTMLPFL